MEKKNKILEIHAKWLHDNGYYKEFMDCKRLLKFFIVAYGNTLTTQNTDLTQNI